MLLLITAELIEGILINTAFDLCLPQLNPLSVIYSTSCSSAHLHKWLNSYPTGANSVSMPMQASTGQKQARSVI